MATTRKSPPTGALGILVISVVILVSGARDTLAQGCGPATSLEIGNGSSIPPAEVMIGVYDIRENMAITAFRQNPTSDVVLFNVTDSTAPFQTNITVQFPTLINTPTVSGDYLFVPDSLDNITVVNVSAPITESFSIISTSDVGSSFLYEAFANAEKELLYVSSIGGQGLIVVNYSDIMTLSFVSGSAEPFTAGGVACRAYGAEEYCYVVRVVPFPAQVFVYNVTDPLNITRVQTITGFTSVIPITITLHPDDPDFAYVAFLDNARIQSIDISNPLAAVVGGSVLGSGIRHPLFAPINFIGDQNQVMWTTTNDGFMNFACIRDRTAPTLINSIATGYVSVGGTYVIPGTSTPLYLPTDIPAGVVDTLFIRDASFCGDGTVVPGEQCDGTSVCCNSTSCLFLSSGTLCSSGTQPCEADATCTGTSATCPPNGVSPLATPCGSDPDAPAGSCVFPTQCDGVQKTCGGGGDKPAGTVCRLSTVLPCFITKCDAAGMCEVVEDNCPPNPEPGPDGGSQGGGSIGAGVLAIIFGSIIAALMLLALARLSLAEGTPRERSASPEGAQPVDLVFPAAPAF